MNFKVGQIVKLVNNEGMIAPIGATAVVKKVSTYYLGVVWKGYCNGQRDGGYYFHQFKPKVMRGEQLLFSFMGE